MIRTIGILASRRPAILNRTITFTPSLCHYSTKKMSVADKINKSLLDKLKHIQEIDERVAQLKATPVSIKVEKIMESIQDKKELLYLLALFHYKCRKIGITQESPEHRQVGKLKFWYNCVFKLKPINDSFWEVMYASNLAEHDHRVNFNVEDLGLLDPKNFPKDVYDSIQSGVFKGLDFKDAQVVLSTDRPKWIEKE